MDLFAYPMLSPTMYVREAALHCGSALHGDGADKTQTFPVTETREEVLFATTM